MNKAELLAAVAAKKGFVRVVSDNLAPDSPEGDTAKRFLVVEHVNADGTAGLTHVYYLHNTSNDVAKFYNVEPQALDTNEQSLEIKKKQALEAYLKGKYQAYFLGRIDLVNNWAEADVFALNAGVLTKKSVLVYKIGANPINDIEVTTI